MGNVHLSRMLSLYDNWRQHRVPRLSAGLAYYTMFSLAPVLVLMTAGMSVLVDESDFQARLFARVGEVYGERALAVVRSLVEGTGRPGSRAVPAVISAIVILYGATRVFSHLQDAFNVIWEVQTKSRPTIFLRLRRRFAAFATTLTAGFLLLLVVVLLPSVQALTPFIRGMPGATLIWGSADAFVTWFVMAFSFAWIYRVLPNVRIRWGDVWMGAGIAALAFLGAQSIAIWYLQSAVGSLYGAAGSFIVILFWFYISGQILLLGAEIAKMYTVEVGSHARLAMALAEGAASDSAREEGQTAGVS